MGKLSHRLFGVLDPGESSWRTTVSYAQRSVDVDLEMDPGAVTETQLKRTLGLIDDLAALDRQARAALAENDEQVEMYRSHHLEQLDAQERMKCFGTADRDAVDKSAFLHHMRLLRVGLYPENADRCLVLDYSIGREQTDYLLVVSFDEKRRVVSVDMES